MTLDYYKVLGIKRDASALEIKRAYRRKAKEVHPDMARGIEVVEAEERFKQVAESFRVLSNPALRKEYDNARGWEESSDELLKNKPNKAEKSDFEPLIKEPKSKFETMFPDKKEGGFKPLGEHFRGR